MIEHGEVGKSGEYLRPVMMKVVVGGGWLLGELVVER